MICGERWNGWTACSRGTATPSPRHQSDIKVQLGGNSCGTARPVRGRFPMNSSERFPYARRGNYRRSPRLWMNFPHPTLRMLAATSRRLMIGIATMPVIRSKCVVNRRQNGSLAFVLLATFILSACAVSPNGDVHSAEGRRELVAKRAMERWNALINGDFAAAYAYMSPASRAGVRRSTARSSR